MKKFLYTIIGGWIAIILIFIFIPRQKGEGTQSVTKAQSGSKSGSATSSLTGKDKVQGGEYEPEDEEEKKRQAIARTFYANGTVSSEWRPVDSAGSGVLRLYHPNERIWFELFFQDGLMEGVSKMYYPTGILFHQVSYSSGQEQGASRYFYPSGAKWIEMNYIAGILSGMPLFYSESGEAGRMGEESDANSAYFQVLDASGKVAREVNTELTASPTTMGRATYQTGQVSAEWNAGGGVFTGPLKLYYPGGAPMFESNWLAGFSQEVAKYYYEDGRPWMEMSFGQQGERLETRGFYPGSTPWFLFDTTDVAGQDTRRKIPKIFSESEFKGASS